MTRSWSTFKIGLFVLGGLALVLAGVAAFGLFSQLRSTTRFETYVEGSIDGLTVGSPVRLKGVRVGEVTEIGFSWLEYPGGTPPCVIVRFTVASGVVPEPAPGAAVRQGVRQGLRAMVETQGITGQAALSLDVAGDRTTTPTLAYSWTPRDPVVPSAPGQLTQLLASAQAALAKLEHLDVEGITASLERTLRSADGAFQEIRRLDAERLSRELRRAVASAGAAAGDVRALTREARARLREVPVEQLAREADSTLLALRTSTERLDQLLDRFSEVDLGEVDATLASARRASQDLEQAMARLRRDPSGFLFGKAPPPAQAVEAER